jgi:hypothetical protein
LALFFLLISACSQINPISVTSETPTSTRLPPEATPTSTLSYRDVMPRSWNKYAYFDWNHDGYPCESENFIVYSDDADRKTKERFAQESEKAFVQILSELEITDAEGIPLHHPKIEIYISNRRFGKVQWQGFAHYGGFLVVYDEETYVRKVAQYPKDFPCTFLIMHELTHVITARITRNRMVDADFSHVIHIWFDEGLATYFQKPPVPIRSLHLYEIAMRNAAHFPEGGNPIYYQTLFNLPLDYPYDLFEVAVYYLVETYGMEKVVGILFDIRNGLSFEQGFENLTGMTVDEYQQNFDLLMREFFSSD